MVSLAKRKHHFLKYVYWNKRDVITNNDDALSISHYFKITRFSIGLSLESRPIDHTAISTVAYLISLCHLVSTGTPIYTSDVWATSIIKQTFMLHFAYVTLFSFFPLNLIIYVRLKGRGIPGIGYINSDQYFVLLSVLYIVLFFHCIAVHCIKIKSLNNNNNNNKTAAISFWF